MNCHFHGNFFKFSRFKIDFEVVFFYPLQVHNDVVRISMHCKQVENSSSFWIPQAVLYKCYTQYKKDL